MVFVQSQRGAQKFLLNLHLQENKIVAYLQGGVGGVTILLHCEQCKHLKNHINLLTMLLQVVSFLFLLNMN